MKKVPTSGDRIKKLRGSRTQAELARELGVKRAAVSAWEGDDKLRKPSAAIFLKLASLTPSREDAEWFIKCAGLTEDALLSAAGKVRKGRSVAAGPDDIIMVGPLAGTTDIDRIPFTSKPAPDPDFTSYFVADIECAQLILAPGVVILDTKDRGNRIEPFWGEIVLARMPELTVEQRLQFPGAIGGYALGKIWKVHPVVPRGVAPLFSLQAWLGGAEEPENRFGSRDRGRLIGHFMHEDWGKEHFHKKIERDHSFFMQASDEAHERAHHVMEAERGCEIVGRVIAWFPHGK